MNLIDIVILLIVAAITGLALRKIIRDKKAGKTCSSCSGGPGCSICAAAADLEKNFRVDTASTETESK